MSYLTCPPPIAGEIIPSFPAPALTSNPVLPESSN